MFALQILILRPLECVPVYDDVLAQNVSENYMFRWRIVVAVRRCRQTLPSDVAVTGRSHSKITEDVSGYCVQQ
jgi:hypothetical protein